MASSGSVTEAAKSVSSLIAINASRTNTHTHTHKHFLRPIRRAGLLSLPCRLLSVPLHVIACHCIPFPIEASQWLGLRVNAFEAELCPVPSHKVVALMQLQRDVVVSSEEALINKCIQLKK